MSPKSSLADPSRLKPIDEKDEIIHVIIETPSGSRNKYSYDEDEKIFILKKVLPAGMTFPYTFGFVPSTKAEDGDPIDVLVLMDEPALQGCLVKCRPIGIIEGEQGDRGKRNGTTASWRSNRTTMNSPSLSISTTWAKNLLRSWRDFLSIITTCLERSTEYSTPKARKRHADVLSSPCVLSKDNELRRWRSLS